MTIKTVAGPFKLRSEADETAKSLGNAYSAFGRYINNDEGYVTDECIWWVEYNDTLPNGKIFGYDENEFLARQHKK